MLRPVGASLGHPPPQGGRESIGTACSLSTFFFNFYFCHQAVPTPSLPHHGAFMPIFADLFALCDTGDPKTWDFTRGIFGHTAHFTVSPLGWARRGRSSSIIFPAQRDNVWTTSLQSAITSFCFYSFILFLDSEFNDFYTALLP